MAISRGYAGIQWGNSSIKKITSIETNKCLIKTTSYNND
jgi:hypothetical protein